MDTPVRCSLCNTSQKYYPLFDNSNSCYSVNNSPFGLYFNSKSSIHQKCDISCIKCDGTSKNCNLCNYADNYFSLFNQPFICVQICPETTWKNFLEKKCSPCHESYNICKDNFPMCEKCSDGFYPLSDNSKSCFLKCPVGYVFDLNNKICRKCSTNCLDCNLDGSCNKCFSSFFLNKKEKICVNTYVQMDILKIK